MERHSGDAFVGEIVADGVILDGEAVSRSQGAQVINHQAGPVAIPNGAWVVIQRIVTDIVVSYDGVAGSRFRVEIEIEATSVVGCPLIAGIMGERGICHGEIHVLRLNPRTSGVFDGRAVCHNTPVDCNRAVCAVVGEQRAPQTANRTVSAVLQGQTA